MNEMRSKNTFLSSFDTISVTNIYFFLSPDCDQMLCNSNAVRY